MIARPLFVLLITSILLCPAAHAATLQGYVRDAQGNAAAGATIELHTAPERVLATAQTDAGGKYLLTNLAAGAYTVRAQINRAGDAAFGPFVISAAENKTIDLILKAPLATAEFFDPPTFTVAGVTDGAYLGGHGSDTVLRSSEQMTRATVNLADKPAGSETQQSLREAIRRDPGNPALHRSLAALEEAAGKPLSAVQEYQRAAELAPSEVNLFDWATELLLHGAPQAAVVVFDRGVALFPASSRMLLGAAAALYAHGDYPDAARRLFQATDLHPADPEPYLFLATVESREITTTDGFLERLARFVTLQPDNAFANYCYAEKLWSARRDPRDAETFAKVQTLLDRALSLDPKLAPAYVQLGMLQSEKHDLASAIASYRRAIELDPALEQAHYRLAEAYRAEGNSQQAQQETSIFKRLAKTSADRREQERSALQKFVISLKSQ